MESVFIEYRHMWPPAPAAHSNGLQVVPQNIMVAKSLCGEFQVCSVQTSTRLGFLYAECPDPNEECDQPLAHKLDEKLADFDDRSHRETYAISI